MRLLTHNMLTSKCMKGVTVGYPLKIQAVDVQTSHVDFNPEFISRIIPKLDWPALYTAAESIGQLEDLPKDVADNYENDVDFLKKAHRVLLEIDIINGDLICPETGRKFPINNGIPNMLLNEDEVYTKNFKRILFALKRLMPHEHKNPIQNSNDNLKIC